MLNKHRPSLCFTAENWYWLSTHFQPCTTYVSYSFDFLFICVTLTVNIPLDLSSGLVVNACYL